MAKGKGNGMFAGLGKATRGFSSNRLTEGEYVVRIDGCAFFPTEMYGKAWKNTLTVLGVISGEHQVGEEVNTTFRENNKSFYSNLKGFLAGVTGSADEDVDDEDGEAALEEDSPINGYVCIVKARKRVHKTAVDDKTGEPIVYYVYDWEEHMTDEEIVESLGEEVVAKFFPDGL